MRMRGPRLNSSWLAIAVTLAVAPSAQAHLMNTGFGPFYDGLTHLFVTPEDLLPVMALALLAGLRGPRFGRSVLFVLPVAWLVGSTAGIWIAPQLTLPGLEIILTIGLGALLAADRPLPFAFIVSLAILLGLFHGMLNGTELAKKPSSGEMVAVGVAVGTGRTGGVGAPPVDACCPPHCWELDRGDRSVDAGLVDARAGLVY